MFKSQVFNSRPFLSNDAPLSGFDRQHAGEDDLPVAGMWERVCLSKRND